MTVNDVAEILHLAQVDPTTYKLYGVADDMCCLFPSGQAWHVFYSEKGNRNDERIFDSEDAACVYFVKWLLGSAARRYEGRY